MNTEMEEKKNTKNNKEVKEATVTHTDLLSPTTNHFGHVCE